MAKPIAVLVTSVIVLFTIHCVDVLAAGKLTALAESIAGAGAGPRFMAVAAVAIGYLTHAFGGTATGARGAVSLIFIGLAGVGVTRGWYDRGLQSILPRLTSDAGTFLGQWGEECTWAAALMVAAIGVALSRGKLVHFLSAVLLGALAYHCVQSGCVKVVSFPGSDISIPDIETVGLDNVALWRWVATGELALLGLILLHLSLGIGGLSLAFALAMMIGGLAAYHEMGTLSLARSLGQFLGQGVAQQPQSTQKQRATTDPLSMWGLPVSEATGPGGQRLPEQPRRAKSRPIVNNHRTPASSSAPSTASGEELAQARQEAIKSLSSPPDRAAEGELLVAAVTPVVWIYVTALLAGVIAATGLRMVVGGQVARALLLMALWFCAGLGSAWLIAQWPRNPEQSWVQWAAAFGTSRYHEQLIWLVFVVCAAVAGLWALWFSRGSAAWIHASIYASFLGTILTLIGVAALIRYGGFPRLPVWTYIVLAAGQSSLAWVLLMHLSLSGGKASERA
jgi:hypothetical protein